MDSEITVASLKLTPPAGVSVARVVGWLDALTTYGQATVIVLTVIYTVAQLYVLYRDKFRRNDEQGNSR